MSAVIPWSRKNKCKIEKCHINQHTQNKASLQKTKTKQKRITYLEMEEMTGPLIYFRYSL